MGSSGGLVVNNMVMSSSVLSIAMVMVSSSMWQSFFDVVDSGLRQKLTVMEKKQ